MSSIDSSSTDEFLSTDISNDRPINTSDTNPQEDSPLFGRVPGEIRNRIFDLALTAYPGKQEPFEKSAYYCRPGFCYADMRIDTDLLLTCRRVYGETRLVPKQNYVHVKWMDSGHEPSQVERRRYCRLRDIIQGNDFYPWITSLHLFAQQSEFEECGWRIYLPALAVPSLVRSLKITIRHCEWRSFANGRALVLDPEKGCLASPKTHRKKPDILEQWYREQMLSFYRRLDKFELELETVDFKREELDDIVARAAQWRFPFTEGKMFVMNPAKTKRTGWHAVKNRTIPPHYRPWRDAKAVKDSLVKDGVNFITWDGEPEVLDHDCMTIYMVSLVYEARDSA